MSLIRLALLVALLVVAITAGKSANRPQEPQGPPQPWEPKYLRDIHDHLDKMTEPVYKLYHFNSRFRGESVRWVLSYAGVQWEDLRTDLSLFPVLGATLPQLEVSGQNLSQSTAIARYIARRHGFAGQNAWEAAQVDALADYAVIDVIAGFRGILEATLQGDQAKAAQLKTEYTNKGIVPHLQNLERKLRLNRGGSGYFFGDQPTFADIIVVNVEDEVVRMKSTVLDKYPILQAHRQRVRNLNGIKQWLQERPETTL
jgi:glutathione S-transferase